MFAYFKPKLLPEFDGYKTSSMSGDLENLFLRITKVIPIEERPEDIVEKIQAYIDGLSDDVPTLSAGVSPNRWRFFFFPSLVLFWFVWHSWTLSSCKEEWSATSIFEIICLNET